MKLLVEIETDKASYTKMVEFKDDGANRICAVGPIVLTVDETCVVERVWLHVAGMRSEVRMHSTTRLLKGGVLNLHDVALTAT
jgi:hypothetical protein